MRFLLGGYSADSGGAAAGIVAGRAGEPDEPAAFGPLALDGVAVAADSPSWIAAHPSLDVIYAALEARGAVAAYRRTGESTYAPLGAPVEVGEAVCHVAVSPDGGMLLASCWGDGRVVALSLNAAGVPSGPTVLPASVDPYATPELPGLPDIGSAARTSRGHQTRFLPGGAIATTDMGLDLVRIWRRDGLGVPHQVGQIVLPAGSGPRHTVWHPSGHLYVLTELSHEVFVIVPDREGAWRLVSGMALPPGVLPGDTAAEISLSRDAETVYAGVRGSNTIAVLRVRGSGAELTGTALVEAGVDWPRNHLVVRDTILVAGERSHEIVALPLDPRTGIPGRVRRRVEAPSPTCILPLR